MSATAHAIVLGPSRSGAGKRLWRRHFQSVTLHTPMSWSTSGVRRYRPTSWASVWLPISWWKSCWRVRSLSLMSPATAAADSTAYRFPPGAFQMGCSPGDTDCFSWEKQPHAVTVRGFWMSRTEVTAGAYRRFARKTGKPMRPALPFNPLWREEGIRSSA